MEREKREISMENRLYTKGREKGREASKGGKKKKEKGGNGW